MRLDHALGPAVAMRIAALRELGPGVLMCLVIAAAATFVADARGGSAILYALLIGLAFAFLAEDERVAPGLAFVSRALLRFGVGLLGARIAVEEVAAIGGLLAAGIGGAVVLTILFGILAARLLRLRASFGVLTAGATAICGASAAVAIASVLPRRPDLERDTAFTVVGVTTLSTLAMVIYPTAARFLGFDDTHTGIVLGATIHDVAQVIGAGYSVSPEAGDTAIIVKLLRVALLLPAVVLVAAASRRVDVAARGSRPHLPLFLVGFVLLMAANSAGFVPPSIGAAASGLSYWCIIAAIAALGMKTSLAALARVGRSAIMLMVAETLFIAIVVVALVEWV